MKLSDMIYEDELSMTPTKAVKAAKDILGENVPYLVSDTADGSVIVWLTDDYLADVAVAIEDNCIAHMSRAGKQLWKEYIVFMADIEDGVRDGNIVNISSMETLQEIREAALVALHAWAEDERNGVEHPVVVNVYNTPALG